MPPPSAIPANHSVQQGLSVAGGALGFYQLGLAANKRYSLRPTVIAMSKRKTSIAKDMPKHFANKKYRLACEDPYLWIRKAREVRRAADLIWAQFHKELKEFTAGVDSDEPFTGDVAMMLYGLVIENLLKGALALKGRASKQNGNFDLKSHALEDLSISLLLPLCPEERELLERLENFIEWAGRYPIPLYSESLYPRNLQSGGQAALYGVSSLDQSRILQFIRKVEALLPTEDEAIEAYASKLGV